MICWDPLSSHSSLPSLLHPSCHWGSTVCEPSLQSVAPTNSWQPYSSSRIRDAVTVSLYYNALQNYSHLLTFCTLSCYKPQTLMFSFHILWAIPTTSISIRMDGFFSQTKIWNFVISINALLQLHLFSVSLSSHHHQSASLVLLKETFSQHEAATTMFYSGND